MTDTPTTGTDATAPASTGDDIPTLTRRRAAQLFHDDAGAATAEYAIATMATIGQVWHTQFRDIV